MHTIRLSFACHLHVRCSNQMFKMLKFTVPFLLLLMVLLSVKCPNLERMSEGIWSDRSYFVNHVFFLVFERFIIEQSGDDQWHRGHCWLCTVPGVHEFNWRRKTYSVCVSAKWKTR